MDRETFLGFPRAERLEKRFLVVEVLVVAEASRANRYSIMYFMGVPPDSGHAG